MSFTMAGLAHPTKWFIVGPVLAFAASSRIGGHLVTFTLGSTLTAGISMGVALQSIHSNTELSRKNEERYEHVNDQINVQAGILAQLKGTIETMRDNRREDSDRLDAHLARIEAAVRNGR